MKTVVIGQIWGEYLKQSSPELIDSLNAMQKWINDSNGKRFYVLLDFPWDTGSFDIRNRAEVKRWDNTPIDRSVFIVNYPSQTDWAEGNLFVEKNLTNAIFIETASKVCPNEKCNLLKSYKDDDHLRASYVKQYATWIDQVFE